MAPDAVKFVAKICKFLPPLMPSQNQNSKYLQEKDEWGEGKIRVSKSACLGRCDEGPVAVVYPESTWYTYVDEHDVKEIIDKQLLNDSIVERLKV